MPIELPPAAAHNPYEQGDSEWIRSEDERLRNMDNWVSDISLQALGDIASKTVLDVGSGSAETTAESIRHRGGEYIALDISHDLVYTAVHSSPLRLVGSAQRLPFADESIDITHSRAVLGWLNQNDRAAAVLEQVRVAKESAVFMNFDWSSIEGDLAIQQLRTLMMRILTSLGYHPEYGRNQHDEIADFMANSDIDATVHTHIYETDATLNQTMSLVKEATTTLSDQLTAFGKVGIAEGLTRNLYAVEEYVNSGGVISLPAVHATTVVK